MKAILRQVRISPKKANLIAALVRTKSINEAVDILKFTNKKPAPVLKKLIESAAANAENNFQQNKDDLYIKEIIVTQGPTYKRGIPVSRGRVHPLLKRTSHITVSLALKDEAKAVGSTSTKSEKSDEKKSATKSEAKVKTKAPAAKKTATKKAKKE
ncbi:50S ribosomal protein L22 [Candidatus Peregrinibacteria bacterium]|nr:50S ribosomal protein L22 [Candidatus Peregrinibacteria bacterium]